MEKIMQNKLALKIICTLLAVVLWFYVSYQENPAVTKTIDNVAIALAGEQALKEKNLSVYSISESSVSVTANGKRLTLARLSPSNLTATVNVSSIKEPGKYTLKATISSAITSDATFITKGKDIVVVIEPIKTNSYAVNVVYDQSDKTELKVKSHELSTEKISVKAPESIFKNIDSVRTEPIIASKEKHTVKVYACDSNGNILDKVECSPSSVDVTLTFYQSKKVPLVLNTASGNSFTLQDNITIYGTSSDLERVNKIGTKPLDLTPFSVGSSVSVEINLPQNILLHDDDNTNQTITLKEEFFK